MHESQQALFPAVLVRACPDRRRREHYTETGGEHPLRRNAKQRQAEFKHLVLDANDIWPEFGESYICIPPEGTAPLRSEVTSALRVLRAAGRSGSRRALDDAKGHLHSLLLRAWQDADFATRSALARRLERRGEEALAALVRRATQDSYPSSLSSTLTQ